jgi:hypothetical protein
MGATVPAPREERKVVTVLFADLVGSFGAFTIHKRVAANRLRTDRVWDEIANPLIATHRVSERCGSRTADVAPHSRSSPYSQWARAKWLGREDSDLESGPERCGTQSGRPSVTSSLIG